MRLQLVRVMAGLPTVGGQGVACEQPSNVSSEFLEDVQYFAGHAEPRTTGLYERRQKKVTRNIVERISI